jgi:hypothetical protein
MVGIGLGVIQNRKNGFFSRKKVLLDVKTTTEFVSILEVRSKTTCEQESLHHDEHYLTASAPDSLDKSSCSMQAKGQMKISAHATVINSLCHGQRGSCVTAVFVLQHVVTCNTKFDSNLKINET